MKFKTKEDITNTIHKDTSDVGVVVVHGLAVDKCFESFAERIKFYKCYRNDILGCYTNRHDIWKDFTSDNKHLKTPGMVDIDYWNNWLFDYTFGDVICQ